jgi:poly(A) polymerase
MREVWMMQTRFERRTPASCASLLEQVRYRAGYDFLRLRAEAGEVEVALADWWDDYARADDDRRIEMLEEVRRSGAGAPKRVRGGVSSGNNASGGRGPRSAAPDSSASAAAGNVTVSRAEPAHGADGDEPEDDTGAPNVDSPPRKRRRRRRKPTGGGEGSGPSGPDGQAPVGSRGEGGPAQP